MTKEKFLYGLNACGVLYHNGQKLYEHDELVKCFEDLELFEQEPFMNKPCVAHQVCHEYKVKVLDKIRTEIELLSNANPSYWHSGDMVEREEVLNIIDKYKAESEGEHG